MWSRFIVAANALAPSRSLRQLCPGIFWQSSADWSAERRRRFLAPKSRLRARHYDGSWEVQEMYWPSSDRDTTRGDDLARLKDIYGFDTFVSNKNNNKNNFFSTVAQTYINIFQALLLLFPNGYGQSTSGIRRYSSFHFCPHPTNLILPVHTLHYSPRKASRVLCKNGFRVSAS